MRITRLRFSIFCLIAFCLLSVVNTKPVFDGLKNRENITYYFYVNQSNLKLSDANVTICGNASIVQCNAKNAVNIKNKLNCISGESVRLKKYSSKTLNDILSIYCHNVVDEDLIDNYKIYYCYDESLSKFVNIDSRKVNIQIAVSDDEINIGYPLILNGF